MINLLENAKELGAVINGGSLCLPAGSLAEFLRAAIQSEAEIRYIECLYFHEACGEPPKGTEPSLDLSRDFVPGQSVEEFVEVAGRLAKAAIEHAARHNVRPYFQVGLRPELDASEADILVRR